MDIDRAKEIIIVDYLNFEGIKPVRHIGDKYWYRSPLRNEQTASFRVIKSLNTWFDFGSGDHGDIIELVKRMKRFGSVSEALREIASCNLSPSAEVKVVAAQQRAYDATSQNMVDIEVLPLQHPALLSYLHTRKIDKEIGCMYCREIHYKIYNKSYFAIAFGNVSGGYEVRNPYFKGCFGNKDITLIPHTFNECQSGCLVFEGFMDFLSFLTLTKKQDKIFAIERKCDYIILNSVYNLKRCLKVLD